MCEYICLMKNKSNFLLSLLFITINAVFGKIDTISVGSSGNNYSPSILTINLGDTVRFVWFTGDHPTAPDTASDWETFQMNPSDTVYDIILNNEGDYPYYCTKHGAPGGLGMSGVITVEKPSSISKMNNNYITIFPNPFSDYITISSDHNISMIDIISINGKNSTTFFVNNGKINLSDINSGVYFLKLYNREKELVNISKIIKK